MYDCQQCGACCVDYFGTAGYIQLDAAEAARMRRLSLPVVRLFGEMTLGTVAHDGAATRCVAFVGEVGGECACAIHEDRPGACRRFQEGSVMCQAAREAAGLPV